MVARVGGLESLIPAIQEELNITHGLYEALIRLDRTRGSGYEGAYRDALLRLEKLQAAIQQKLDEAL